MKKKTSVTLDIDLLIEVKRIADLENRSISQEIEKRLLDFYFPNKNKS